MNFDDIRLFICLAETLSFTQTAKRMYISPSAVSARILELETQVGAQLISRTTRSVELTEAGSYFLEEARRLIQKLDQIKRDTRLISSEKQSSFSVGYSDGVGSHVVAEIMVKYIQEQPDTGIQIRKADYSDLLRNILKSDIDVGFTFTNHLGSTAPICSIPLLSARIKVLLCRDHPLADKHLIKLSELVHEQLLVVEKKTAVNDMTDAVNLLFGRQGIVCPITKVCSSPEELAMLVGSGRGIGIVSDFFGSTQQKFHALKLIPISHITETRTLFMLYHSDNLTPYISSFLHSAQRTARRLAADRSELILPI